MRTEAAIERHGARLRARLERMLGARELAEDICQEAFLRLWQRGPADLAPGQEWSWLNRTASNLALDELRRRRLREQVPLDEAAAAVSFDGSETLAVHEALGRLSAHQRLLVLLRFQAGLTYGEIAELIAIKPEAARKRVGAARRRFATLLREGKDGGEPPVILLETRDEHGPYRRWLEAAGARVMPVEPALLERQLAVADGLVAGGSVIDLDPSLYGEAPRVRLRKPDPERDVRELRTVRAALEAGLPYLGICKGAQLLNVVLGGSLYQDLQADGATRSSHADVEHPVLTEPGSVARRVLGRRATVKSEHHQAARRIGRGLRGTSRSADAVHESVELPGGRFVLGVQWHPERTADRRAGPGIARSIVAAAGERRDG
jgi:putative glutamine amidotransferase